MLLKQSGLIYLRSFRFKNGTLDDDFIFEKVKNKNNIFCEILCVKKASKPFGHIIINIKTEENVSHIPSTSESRLNLGKTGVLKSRPIYEIIKKTKGY